MCPDNAVPVSEVMSVLGPYSLRAEFEGLNRGLVSKDFLFNADRLKAMLTYGHHMNQYTILGYTEKNKARKGSVADRGSLLVTNIHL